MNEPRILELLDAAAAAGIPLPLPPEGIIALEDAGHLVDLATGEVVYHADELTFNLTVVGEATLFLLNVEGEVKL